jgi:hypothetical protein
VTAATNPGGPTPRPERYPSTETLLPRWRFDTLGPVAVDWHAAWVEEAAKFQAETATTSFLATLLRNTDGYCTRCADRRGETVRVGEGLLREWLCALCASAKP